MKGLRLNLLLFCIALFLGACAPILPTGQPVDFASNSTPSLDGSGQQANPNDGTVGSQVEPQEMTCEQLVQFRFPGEPRTLWTAPTVKVRPLNPTWNETADLLWEADSEDTETPLPPCQNCIGSVLRIISLGKFSDPALNQSDAAEKWFEDLLNHQTLDQVYGSEVVYQDFEITDPLGISLKGFPFETDGNYLFFILEDNPDSFAGRGEKSLNLGNFSSKEEFAGNLGGNSCSSKGRLRAMRLIQSRFLTPPLRPIL